MPDTVSRLDTTDGEQPPTQIGEIVTTVPKQPTYTWIGVEGNQHTDVLPFIKE